MTETVPAAEGPGGSARSQEVLTRQGSSRVSRWVTWSGDLRLLPSAVCGWAAASLAVQGEARAVTSAGLLSAALGLLLGCVVFLFPERQSGLVRRLPALSLPPVAAVTLVLLSTGGGLARAEAGPLDELAVNGSSFTAILRVTGEPSLLAPGAFGDGDRYLVDADVIGGVLHREVFASRTPVVVIGGAAWAEVGTGDTVRVLGTADPPDRPGRARAVFLPSTQPVVEDADGWLGYTDGLRSRFRDLALRDGSDGGLLPGMALGDRIALDPGTGEAMKRTGLTHLTAVSGANCSYVVAFAFLGLRLLRLPRASAAAGAVVALAAFVMLVRPEPSVLRAAVMGAIGVAAVLSGRGRVSLTLLMLSIIILLAVDPWLSLSIAFMLSVAATLGLVTAGPMVVTALGSLLPRVAAQLLAIPLTAQLFCTPIIVLIQPALAVYSLPANVLAAPVVPAVTLLGMAVVLALVAAPMLAPFLVSAAQWGTRWVAGVADTLAAAPGASLPWLPGAPGAVLAALGSSLLLLGAGLRAGAAPNERRGTAADAAGVLTVLRRVTGHPHSEDRRGGQRRPSAVRAGSRGGEAGDGRNARNRKGRNGWTNRRSAVVLLALLAGVTAAIAVAGRLAPPVEEDWVMAMCDVGQGDGIVVRTTPGHALVVDAGPDAGAMDGCLDSLDVEVIDALVITHLHEDHYGGIEGVVRGREVSAVYYSSGEPVLPPVMSEAAGAAGVEPQRVSSATELEVMGIELDVLWPLPDTDLSEENNASVVLEIGVPVGDRTVTLLLTGDLEEDGAARMLSAMPAVADGGVDILKVAHHGARNGGSMVIEAVEPQLALISVGADNDYGHPHPTIVEALTRADIATARTDELGSFLVRIVGSTMEVRPLQ